MGIHNARSNRGGRGCRRYNPGIRRFRKKAQFWFINLQKNKWGTLGTKFDGGWVALN